MKSEKRIKDKLQEMESQEGEMRRKGVIPGITMGWIVALRWVLKETLSEDE